MIQEIKRSGAGGIGIGGHQQQQAREQTVLKGPTKAVKNSSNVQIVLDIVEQEKASPH
jgi:hypothetical protein